jgi:putative endonuclease
MILPYCVYVLISKTDLKLYIGFTTNIRDRLTDHNSGGTKSTSPRRPLKLLFCEQYISKKDAVRREKYLKTTAGKKALKIMLRETMRENDYAHRLKDYD